MKDLYSFAICAMNPAGGAKMASGACAADSEAEAEGIALYCARKRWPPEEGFYQHQEQVYYIPNEWVAMSRQFFEAAKNTIQSDGKEVVNK